MNGGYDDGYRACPCFWGKEPGSLVKTLALRISDFSGMQILDVGCGEGKNAAFLASRGATVAAFDISDLAIANAKAAWPPTPSISFEVGNIETMELREHSWDVVVMYGLLHCLPHSMSIKMAIRRLQNATKPEGFHVICAFNDRAQDLSAHKGFIPTLLPHSFYVEMYAGWNYLELSDCDLHEIHPHNNIPHTHSMTRLLAQKV